MCHCHLFSIDIVGQNCKNGAEVNIKIEPLPAHSINLAEKFPGRVAKRTPFLKGLLHYQFGQLTSLSNPQQCK